MNVTFSIDNNPSLGFPSNHARRHLWSVSVACLGGVLFALSGCGDLHKPVTRDVDANALPEETSPVDAGAFSPIGSLTIVTHDPSDSPLTGLNEHWDERFALGDAAFEQIFRASQGLGPVYIRQSCASCHADDARGPGAARKMVNVAEDGVTPTQDQSMFPYGHTVRPQSVDAELYPGVTEPEPFEGLLVSSRLGPAVFGRGAMEAILDSEIERLEAEQQQRADGISGRINRVSYQSETNVDSPFRTFAKGEQGLIGRFGLKARIATLDEFAADAYQGDMGITSPLRPDELPNPADAVDDDLPGLDIDLDTVNSSADYVRLLRIPTRKEATQLSRGEYLFVQVQCSVCHATDLRTDPSYPIEQWADTRVDIYSDLLLHAMGRDLADGMIEGDAHGDEWRTAPLVGIRHLKSLMHDGRAKSVKEAILAHASEGSEANASVDAFTTLDETDQDALLAFVQSL
jgi:CxxC motif-containing protein (DUF1111 family)